MVENNPSFQSCSHWDTLLDAICLQKGHLDNSDLAEKLCAMSGNTTRDSFETMQRNLQNWRNGTHVPQRRNFLRLTKVLEVESDKALSRQWTRLYRGTTKRDRPGTGGAPSIEGGTQIRRLRFLLIGSGVCMIALCGLVLYLLLAPAPQQLGYANIVYQRFVKLNVGETKVIHGRRSSCGQMPPEWDVIKNELPEMDIGTWSDGGIGIRNSRSCAGPTPARALVFTATTRGQRNINLYNDPVTIKVE